MTPFPLEGKGKRYPAHAVKRARSLRRKMTLPEQRLWKALRKTALHCRHQVPIGPCVVDFACLSARLVIVVDGPVHDLFGGRCRDAKRDEWLRSEGYRVLRFRNHQVMDDLEGVMEVILQRLAPRGRGP